MSEENQTPTEVTEPEVVETTKEAEPGPTEWVREIGGLFGAYNQQIVQLTGQKAELEFSIGQVANTILQLCPELIGQVEGRNESVCECAARLITEYVELRKKVTSGEGSVPEVADGQAGDPGQGPSGDGAVDPGLGEPGQPG